MYFLGSVQTVMAPPNYHSGNTMSRLSFGEVSVKRERYLLVDVTARDSSKVSSPRKTVFPWEKCYSLTRRFSLYVSPISHDMSSICSKLHSVWIVLLVHHNSYVYSFGRQCNWLWCKWQCIQPKTMLRSMNMAHQSPMNNFFRQVVNRPTFQHHCYLVVKPCIEHPKCL